MNFCTKCGNRLKDGDRFCEKCGSAATPMRAAVPTGNAAPAPVMTPTPPPKSSKMPIVILIGIASILVLTAIILVLVFGVLKSDSRRFEKQLELGQKFIVAQEYEQAVESLRKAIEIDPKQTEAYILLADVYMQLEDYETALLVLDEAEFAGAKDRDGEIESKREAITIIIEEIAAEQAAREAEEASLPVEEVEPTVYISHGEKEEMLEGYRNFLINMYQTDRDWDWHYGLYDLDGSGRLYLAVTTGTFHVSSVDIYSYNFETREVELLTESGSYGAATYIRGPESSIVIGENSGSGSFYTWVVEVKNGHIIHSWSEAAQYDQYDYDFENQIPEESFSIDDQSVSKEEYVQYFDGKKQIYPYHRDTNLVIYYDDMIPGRGTSDPTFRDVTENMSRVTLEGKINYYVEDY